MASANSVLDQFSTGAKLLETPPAELDGTVAARVVGYGTRPAFAAEGVEGKVLGYDGEGFPTQPGFGLVLVEDSAETFQGVLIFDIEPPRGITQLGTISNTSTTLPLFGARVTWAAVSNDRCPLFGPIDSSPVEAGS